MAFSINQFKGALSGGGARPDLFEVTLSAPTAVGGDFADFNMLCQATTAPGVTIGVTELNYFGRQVKLAGNKTFDDWQTTILNDEDYAIRKGIEAWSDFINNNEGNVRNTSSSTPSSYMGTATVKHFSKKGAGIREYDIFNIWPSAIAELTMDWSENDSVQTFDVTWTFSHWISKASSA